MYIISDTAGGIMKTLIVYTSKHGYSRECAQKIAKGLGPETDLVELTEAKPEKPLTFYDQVVIGGGIHTGSLSRKLKRYCRINKHELGEKRLGLYLCATNREHAEEQFLKSYPEVLLGHATAKGWFGGRIILAEHKDVTLFILKKILKSDKDLHAELPEAVEAFIDKMQKQ